MHFKIILIFFVVIALPTCASLMRDETFEIEHPLAYPKYGSNTWKTVLVIGVVTVIAVGLIYGSKCYNVCRLYISDRMERKYLGKYTMMDTISHI